MLKFKKLIKKINNYALFLIFRVRIFTRKKMKEISLIVKVGDKILEVGSGGKNEKGEYYFSAERYFKNKDVEFIKSDIDSEFGHKIVDIVNFNEIEQYDHILCFNILEHVFDWQEGFLNLYKSLKKNGVLYIIVPVFYPIHPSPQDYWRFTEEAFFEFSKRNSMKIEKLEIHGFKKFPFAYYLIIKKL
jgi:SAM-dependent methyltransferase